jgi:hypothetical protein
MLHWLPEQVTPAAQLLWPLQVIREVAALLETPPRQVVPSPQVT